VILVAEETAPEPKTEKISFSGKLIGSLDGIRDKIKRVPFYSSKIEGSELVIVRVESRNIHKKPYLFHIISITGNELSVIYSIPHDTSENMRRAVILKNMASLISMISDQYDISEGTFMQYIDSVLDHIINGLSQPYSTLFNKYDVMLGEYRELKRLNLELASSNRNLTIQSAQLNDDNKKLSERLKTLQTYSDGSLMGMVQDWIEVHNNTIDINEFAKNHGVAAPRVEEILDKMVSMGYLSLQS
jgi:hypothetical protein